MMRGMSSRMASKYIWRFGWFSTTTTGTKEKSIRLTVNLALLPIIESDYGVFLMSICHVCFPVVTGGTIDVLKAFGTPEAKLQRFQYMGFNWISILNSRRMSFYTMCFFVVFGKARKMLVTFDAVESKDERVNL